MATLIKTIPHNTQRYNTVGDYETKDALTEIRVSELQDSDMEFLVAIHELVESYLCARAGITDAAIDKFDLAFAGRSPGDDTTAPYHRQHMFATEIEKRIAEELGVDWGVYEARITEIMKSH